MAGPYPKLVSTSATIPGLDPFGGVPGMCDGQGRKARRKKYNVLERVMPDLSNLPESKRERVEGSSL